MGFFDSLGSGIVNMVSSPSTLKKLSTYELEKRKLEYEEIISRNEPGSEYYNSIMEAKENIRRELFSRGIF